VEEKIAELQLVSSLQEKGAYSKHSGGSRILKRGVQFHFNAGEGSAYQCVAWSVYYPWCVAPIRPCETRAKFFGFIFHLSGWALVVPSCCLLSTILQV